MLQEVVINRKKEKTIKQIYFSLFIIIVILNNLTLYAKDFNLSAAVEKQTLKTLAYSIRSMLVKGDSAIILPIGVPFIIKHDLSKKIDHLKPYAHGKKIELPEQKDSHMRFVEFVNDRYLMLDGIRAEISLYTKELTLISKHSLAYDLMLPPRDRGGEAPKWEINKNRAEFIKNYNKAYAEKFAGFVSVPESWIKSTKLLFFIATRIKNYPIVIMECEKSNPSQCRLKRSCFTEGFSQLPEGVSGIAVRSKQKQILLGDAFNQSITSYRFNSCFDIVRKNKYILPKTLKKMSSIEIDDKDRLWVTTLKSDDYLNSNIYWWPKDEL